MRRFVAVLFLLTALCCAPAMAAQQTYEGQIISDHWAGYGVFLPIGWEAVTDQTRIMELFKDVCAFAYTDEKSYRELTNVQAGVLPGAPNNAAVVTYCMDYRIMGLNEKTIQALVEDAEHVLADVANTIQASYKEKYPNSIMINSYLENDTFILNLRSVLDFANEDATTRHQVIRMTFGKECIIGLASLYTGPQDPEMDEIMSRILREVYIDTEKTFAKAAPPYETGIKDYLIWIGLVLFVLYLVGRRKLKKQGKA